MFDGVSKKGINRREFLKSAGAGMAAFALSSCQKNPNKNAASSFQKPNFVIIFTDDQGYGDNELTIPEILKHQGYTSACIGKWHLGHHEKFLPLRHDFDAELSKHTRPVGKV